IALSFLADVRDAPQGPAKTQARFFRRAEKPQQGDESCAVIGNAGKMQDAAVPAQLQFHVTRENRVEVRANNQRIRTTLVIRHDDIPDSVDDWGKSERAKSLCKMLAAFFFVKRRRRYQREANLIRLDLRFSL